MKWIIISYVLSQSFNRRKNMFKETRKNIDKTLPTHIENWIFHPFSLLVAISIEQISKIYDLRVLLTIFFAHVKLVYDLLNSVYSTQHTR